MSETRAERMIANSHCDDQMQQMDDAAFALYLDRLDKSVETTGSLFTTATMLAAIFRSASLRIRAALPHGDPP